ASHAVLCYSSRETRTTTQEPCGCAPPGMESRMRLHTRGVPRHPPFYGWWMVWLGGFLSSLNKTAINKGSPVFVAPVREGFCAGRAGGRRSPGDCRVGLAAHGQGHGPRHAGGDPPPVALHHGCAGEYGAHHGWRPPWRRARWATPAWRPPEDYSLRQTLHSWA